MSLTTRPTGHGVYKDAIVCAAVFGGAWNTGRIYERPGFSAAVRFTATESTTLRRPRGSSSHGPALNLQIACRNK